MDEFGVQEDGSFDRKHIDEIRDSLRNGLKQRAGGDIDLEQGTPQQQIIDMMSDEFARQWEVDEQNYYAAYYKDASGRQLDKLMDLAGFSREERQGATGEVVFSTETQNLTDSKIEAGTEVLTQESETIPAIPFETTEDEILEAGETSVTVPVKAKDPWDVQLDEDWLGEETNVSSNTIDQMATPISGIDSVTNQQPTGVEDSGYRPGRDREKDHEFRLRYENSRAEGGSSTLPAIEANVFESSDEMISVDVDEVRDPAIGYGPEVTVFGPDVPDDVVAEAIYFSRAAGTESIGTESGTFELDDGSTKTEKFNRSPRVDIHVDVTVTTGQTFPSDGLAQIEENIVRHIGGTLAGGGTVGGLAIGEDVVYDQVFREVMEIPGTIMADLQIGTSQTNMGTSDSIPVGDKEVAMVSEASVHE